MSCSPDAAVEASDVAAGTEADVEIKFTVMSGDVDHIAGSEAESPGNVGGDIDPAGGMEGHVMFSRVGQQTFHRLQR